MNREAEADRLFPFPCIPDEGYLSTKIIVRIGSFSSVEIFVKGKYCPLSGPIHEEPIHDMENAASNDGANRPREPPHP